MNLGILIYEEGLIDIVIQKKNLGGIYCRVDRDNFLKELHDILVNFKSDYDMWIHYYPKKEHIQLELKESSIHVLNRSEKDFKKSLEFLVKLCK